MGETAALAMWMSWKCALNNLPYGGAKRRRGLRSDQTLARMSSKPSRAVTCREMIPFVGPHTDIMGPDMGTNEQVMAWFMDTYSVYQGYCRERDRHRQTGIRSAAPKAGAKSTGRGVVYLIERAMDMLKMDPEKSHRDHPGIRQRRLGRRVIA